MKDGINVLSLFDGMSGGQQALDRLSVKVNKYYASEIDKYAIAVTQHNYPDTIQLGDITKWEEWSIDWKQIDMVIGGSPCFTADTKVICSDRIKDISDVSVGDMVLTHRGRYKPVIKIGNRLAETYTLMSQSSTGTVTTSNHPYYVRSKINGSNNLCEPEWIDVANISPKKHFVGTPIITEERNPYAITEKEGFIIGAYIGDGHTRKDYRTESGRENHRYWQMILSVRTKKIESFRQIVGDDGYSLYKHSAGTHRIVFSNKRLVEYVEKNCGIGAENKMFGKGVLDLPVNVLRKVIDGYLFTDGSYRKNTHRATTVSRHLVETLTIAVAKVYGVTTSVEFTRRPGKTVIEGRLVNQRDTWTMSFRKEYKKRGNAVTIDNIVWNPVKSTKKTGLIEIVYNLEVADDNSYIANNHIVHNCQGLSSSGKGEGLLDERSKLFWEWVDIRNHVVEHNPNVIFLLENVVPKKKEWRDNMTVNVGVEPIMINSSLLSAQSRKRLYWTNIDGIEQPNDRFIYLQDIIESVDPDSIKRYCIDANYFKGGNLKQYFEKSRRQLVFDTPVQVAHIDENRQGRRIYATSGKSITISANGGNLGRQTGLYITGAAERVRYDENKESFIKTELRDDNKSNAVISVNRRKYLAAIYPSRIIGRRINQDGVREDYNENIERRQIVELKFDGKSNNLSTVGKDTTVVESLRTIPNNIDRIELQKVIKELIDSGYLVIRMLTPIECERLQTIEDDYTKYGNFDGKVKEISKTQRYKMLGNGWTIDVIAHILSFIPQIKSGEWVKK